MTGKTAEQSSVSGRRHNTRHLLWYALASRLLLLTLIILWRSLLCSYDSSSALNPPCLSTISSNSSNPSPSPPSVLLPLVGSAIENSVVWDGVHFLRIAECGYEYEHSYAFLPLLPICIRILSKAVFGPLVPVIGYRAVLGLSGYLLSNTAFVFAALYLYRLSIIVLKDSEVALRASILFSLNPASIFYSSIYSESLYALLSFGGLYHFLNGAGYIATFWLALSGFTRSNGVLNAGSKANEFMSLALRILVYGASSCLCIFAPFICFQLYGYFNICRGQSVDELRPWCKARLPLLYNYIQSHYWGVGFLRYFHVKQLPNFLLASPILSLALCAIIYYMKLLPNVFITLGIQAPLSRNELVGTASTLVSKDRPRNSCFLKSSSITLQDDDTPRLRRKAIKGEKLVMKPLEIEALVNVPSVPVVIVPFVLHLCVMVSTAFFVMHVQVATRFLSSSPVLYWFASLIMGSPGTGKKWGYFIWSYCVAYILLGSLLFSNFYPFT
ncbi:GPI mannosyltransferase 2 [Dorcoceras hygrometricum]|uniref:GPI mannosyltransferase 2 n=1 Tax=Dorcoceras hygrometricum TaxID=472368 RepID=A0A2Z7AJJ2_9LAMI|nr:GPI mannosyltransferase 2 [Dorcoceras hygrometricum]